jgi:hypothetical protein
MSNEDDMSEEQRQEWLQERRIAKRYARWEHALDALALMEEEGDHEAAALLRREMELLEPYWNQPGVTKEQAVAAFHAARN